MSIFALAPMDGVTDLPFRLITKKYGRPDLMFTEFLNVEGWHFAPQKLEHILQAQLPLETPLIAQIYGLKPEFFYQAAEEICARGFAGIDLNFGCPAKTVISHGAGGGLIQNPSLAKEIFVATQTAVNDYAQKHHTPVLPVSIKTRIGYHSDQTDDWFPFLLELQPACLSVHGRTLKQGYNGQADWLAIAKAVFWRVKISPKTTIFGNGDLKSRAQALEAIKQSGVDGVLLGRSAIGNPWVFTDYQPTIKEKAQVALEHAQLFEKIWQKKEKYHFLPMRKYLAAYISDFPQAKKLRIALMQTQNAKEVAEVLAPLL